MTLLFWSVLFVASDLFTRWMFNTCINRGMKNFAKKRLQSRTWILNALCLMEINELSVVKTFQQRSFCFWLWLLSLAATGRARGCMPSSARARCAEGAALGGGVVLVAERERMEEPPVGAESADWSRDEALLGCGSRGARLRALAARALAAIEQAGSTSGSGEEAEERSCGSRLPHRNTLPPASRTGAGRSGGSGALSIWRNLRSIAEISEFELYAMEHS